MILEPCLETLKKYLASTGNDLIQFDFEIHVCIFHYGTEWNIDTLKFVVGRHVYFNYSVLHICCLNNYDT